MAVKNPTVVTPETYASPWTCSFEVGFVVPIPRLPLEGLYTNSVVAPKPVVLPNEVA